MASRFDLALGKVPVKEKKFSKPFRAPEISQKNFSNPVYNSPMSHLKIVNELNGQELRLTHGNINLSIACSEYRNEMLTTLNISITVPAEEAQQLMKG